MLAIQTGCVDNFWRIVASVNIVLATVYMHYGVN